MSLRSPKASSQARPPKRFDVVGFGLNSVDHICVVKHHPRLDSKQQLVTYDVQPGGQVPTALVALQRWGLRTAYVGAFGDDSGGVMARAALEEDGIDLSATTVRAGMRHQVSVILVDDVSGERSVMGETPGLLRLRDDELRRELLTAGNILLMDAVDIPTACIAAAWAKEAGVCTVLDIDEPAAGIDELLRFTDVLITGAEFPSKLTGKTDLRAALRDIAARGPWFTGVTLGAGGALALVRGRYHFVPAFRLPVVDSTGAGDVFHAGSIYGLLQGWDADETIRFAAGAAALKCGKLGARPGIPPLKKALTLAGPGNGR
jgi:sugar/nucleoside kinase (ribokinase family)